MPLQKGGSVDTETLSYDPALDQPQHAKQDVQPTLHPHDIQQQEHEVQLRLARQVQQKFYRPAPAIPGYDVAAVAHPAYETSGDYFDFIPLPNSRIAIAVGDVEGHGFGSALVMSLTRAYVRSFAALDMEAGQILTRVNRMLINDIGDQCLVTMALASLDIPGRTLSFAGAGHVPGYIVDASGVIKHTLESAGMPLGLFPEAQYERGAPLPIRPGETLVLLTDGMTESAAPNGSEWGQDGLLSYVAAHRTEPARQLVDGLYQAARQFSGFGLQQDDITVIVIKTGE